MSKKRRILIYIVVGMLCLNSCQLKLNKEVDNPESSSTLENSVTDPAFADFTILDSSDLSLFMSNIENATSKTLWMERKIVYPKKVSLLNQEILCSTKWNLNPIISDTVHLLFYMDNKFAIGSYFDGPQITGKYELTSDISVRLYDIKYNGLGDYFDSSKSELTLTFKTELNDLFYKDQFILDEKENLFFGPTNGESLNERVYNYGDDKVIKNLSKVVTTERLMFRTGPSTSFDSIRISYGDQLTTSDGTFTNFLKGTELEVWARTVNKESIGDKNAYWYYVSYRPFDKSIFGWVYGAYVEEYIASNDPEYKSRFEKELNTVNGQ